MLSVCCQANKNNYHTDQSQLTQQVIFAETEQNSSRIRVINKGIWAEKAIFTSTAGRQNNPFYEQNLSKPSF